MNDYTAILDPLFEATERGNILLSNTEENWMNAWVKVPAKLPTAEVHEDVWLEIAWRPCNYPALTVQTVRATEAELAKHINDTFAEKHWLVHNMNIAGVKVNKNSRIEVLEPANGVES